MSSSLPSAPGSIPLLGHSWALLRMREKFFTRGSGNNTPVSVLKLGTRRIYLVNDLELVRNILHREAGVYKRGELFARFRPYLGDNINTADGARHRQLRRIYRPAFRTAVLDESLDSIMGPVRQQVRAWAPGLHPRLHDELYDLVLTVSARAFFPAQLAEKTMRVINDAVPGIVQGMFLRMFSPFNILERLPLPANRRFESSMARLSALADDLIRQYRDAGLDVGEDLVSRLVQAMQPATGEALDQDQLRSELATFVLTSSLTTAATAGWCCRLLSTRPELRSAVRQEVDAVLGVDRAWTSANLRRLSLTQAVVKETLRFRPAVHLLTREPIHDVELAGHRVPAGSTIAFSIYAIHHDPTYFPDPDCFDPHRWNTPGRANPDAFLPFALGLHACIGSYLATQEVVMLVAAVIQNWDLTPVDVEVRDRPAGLVLRPGPVPVVLRERVGGPDS